MARRMQPNRDPLCSSYGGLECARDCPPERLTRTHLINAGTGRSPLATSSALCAPTTLPRHSPGHFKTVCAGKETRAWTIRKGWTAPQAAGVIHTDFQRGFIKAEVVSFDELVAAGSMAEAKSRGKVRIEGKDYVMADGDVVEFRFNV